MYINSEIIGNNVHIWERNGPERRVSITPCEWSCYVEDPKGQHDTLDGKKATYFEFDTRFQLQSAVQAVVSKGKRIYESDVPPDLKALAKLYPYKEGNVAPINVTYLDIEVDYRTISYDDDHEVTVRVAGKTSDKTAVLALGDIRHRDDTEKFEVFDERSNEWVNLYESDYMYSGPTGFSSTTNPYAPINAVALSNEWTDKTYVIAVPPPAWGKDSSKWKSMLSSEFEGLGEIILVKNEKELLTLFLDLISDSDALIGWNSEFFDFPYILSRVELVLGTRGLRKLSFPEAQMPKLRPMEIMGRPCHIAQYGGRVLMDYMQLFKKFEMAMRPSYKLEVITEEVLPHLRKLEYDGTLEQLYRRDFNHFIRYNLRDTECLRGFEAEKGYVGVANQLYHMSCGRYKDVAGTLRLADTAILNYCHDVLNVVAPSSPTSYNTGEVETEGGDEAKAKGAFVLDPKAGLQEFIGSIDITSLYPTAIRSVNISPEMLRGQFMENVLAFEHIYNNSDTMLTLQMEDTDEFITKSAIEWKAWLKERSYAISGYGTVYDQSKGQGVIPSILTSWFDERKRYQRLKKDTETQLRELIARNTTTAA